MKLPLKIWAPLVAIGTIAIGGFLYTFTHPCESIPEAFKPSGSAIFSAGGTLECRSGGDCIKHGKEFVCVPTEWNKNEIVSTKCESIHQHCSFFTVVEGECFSQMHVSCT